MGASFPDRGLEYSIAAYLVLSNFPNKLELSQIGANNPKSSVPLMAPALLNSLIKKCVGILNALWLQISKDKFLY